MSAPSEPPHLKFLAGITEHRKALLQEVSNERRAKKIIGRPFVVGLRRLVAHRLPIAGRIVIAAEPRERHKINLLILRKGIDERRELLNDRVVLMVFEDRNIHVIRWIRSGL